jgi:adenylate cyclase
MVADSAHEAATFSKVGSAFLTNLSSDLAQRFGRPEDRIRMIAGMRKAGIPTTEAIASDQPLSASAKP